MVFRNVLWYGAKRGYEYFVGLAVTVGILVLETVVLLYNVDSVRIDSVERIFKDFKFFSIYFSYTMSIILIPLATSWAMDVSKDLVKFYKIYVVKSLKLETSSFFFKGVYITIMMTVVSFGLIVIGVIMGSAQLLLFSLAPLIALVTILLKPFIDVENHEKGIDRELKWFIFLLIVIESAKSNIGFLINKLRRAPVLPSIARELRVIERDSKLYYPSYIDALMHRAEVTPSRKFSKILTGYASKLRSGSDPYPWLKARLDEELMYEELSLKMFADRILTLLGQFALAIYVIMPLISLSMAMYINVQLTIAIAVVVTPILIAITYSLRPRTPEAVSFKHALYPFAVLIAISIVLYRYLGVYSIALGWALAIVLHIPFYLDVKKAEVLNNDSIEILRNIVELRRVGFSIPRALRYFVENKLVKKVTAERIRYVLKLVEHGHSISNAIDLEKASFFFRFTLFSLDIIHESGGGTPEIFQELYEFMNRARIFENSIKRVSIFFDIFAIANAFLLTWIWNSMHMLYTVFTPIPVELAQLLAIISSLSYSLISTVIKRGVPLFEPRNTAFLLSTLATLALIKL